MKRVWPLFTLLFFHCAVANAQNDPKPILPGSTFNETEAKRLLEPGTCTINGVVKKLKKRPDNTYLGIEITLFPCTAYFNEWYELQKKNKKGKTFAVMSPEAYSYRILAKAADKDGTFSFRNLKPGKYYLQTMVRQQRMKKMLNQVGESDTYTFNVMGQTLSHYREPIYEEFKLFYETNDLEKAFVEITKEGEVATVKL
ncbi:hypothetical protein ACTJJ0_02710 [Chitinophaga sp. 22321]|uniref:Carboxypeptidase regulatory-like domain-containing protein n=1 Tax=Chitinophaga hostae TaxID=2831022 RepID=A0ABS5IU94_9BACT|nr:hypothetical protein [Chitinophaga hostae]MBS0026538.1 hypothetical protein [Chitinophaga hostae]